MRQPQAPTSRPCGTLGTIGSLHVAHISKADGSDQKPFGSAFWHNGARATWYVKRAEGDSDEARVTIALYNRKANLGPLRPAIGYEITFSQDEGDVPALRPRPRARTSPSGCPGGSGSPQPFAGAP